MLEVVSAGIGVQSTTVMLMAAHGGITPMPDVAIFADTGGEPAATYEHLEWLQGENVLPFPLEVIQWSNLEEDILRSAKGERGVAGRMEGYLAPPFRSRNEDGSSGMIRRECTQNYKIEPIQRHTKKLLGMEGQTIRSKEPLVRQWIGFSADEFHRAGGRSKKQPRWLAKRYPLIEELTGDGLGNPGDRWMSLGDCLEWLKRHGYPIPPRSACVFCPYLSNERWRAVRDVPSDWERATAVDEAIRDMPQRKLTNLHKGGLLYLHHSLTPLAEADLKDPPPEQASWMSEFTDECEGMCGL